MRALDEIPADRNRFLAFLAQRDDAPVPELRPDAVNLHISVPCPLKVRLKGALEDFVATYNASHAVPVHCPTLVEGGPHAFEDVMAAAAGPDDLPDVWLTNNYHTLLTQPFKARFIDAGVYVGATRPEWLGLLSPFFRSIAARHNLGFLGFGSWGLVMDESVDSVTPLPTAWADLADPRYAGEIGMHGCSSHVSGTALLMVLRAQRGMGAIRRFAGNVRYIRHFSQIIKGMDANGTDRARFVLMPSAAIRQIPSRKRVVQLALSDGPLLTPMLLFVKRDKLEASAGVLDFLWGQAMRDVLAKGDIATVDAMDWSQPYTMADMDYLVSHDFDTLSNELDAEFQAGLPAHVKKGE